MKLQFITAISVIFLFILAAPPNVSAAVSWNQNNYWFRDDDGTEVTATGFGSGDTAKNTAISNVSGGTTFRLRLSVKATVDNGTFSPQLEFQQGTACNGGTWTAVTSATSTFTLQASSNFTDGDATTQQISTGQFVSGQILESTNPAASVTVGRNKTTEYEWSLKLADGAPLDTTYAFRITDNGTALNTYSKCPNFTTEFTTPPPSNVSWQQRNFWFRDDDGTEVTATGLGSPSLAKDNGISFAKSSEWPRNFRIRFAVRAQMDDGFIAPFLQYKESSFDDSDYCAASGNWQTVASQGTRFVLRASDNFPDGDATTQQISAGQFEAGKILESTNPAAIVGVSQNKTTEYEWSLEDTVGFVGDRIYAFRITNNGTAFNSYSGCAYVAFLPAPTGVVPPTNLNISGRAYPGAQIFVVEKGFRQDKLIAQSAAVSESGDFMLENVGIVQGSYSYGLIVKDKEGRQTQTKVYNVDFTADSSLIKDVFVPPTVDLLRSAVRKGDFIKVIGYASPGNKVSVRLENGISYETTADENGNYELLINTARFSFGKHSLRVRQKDSKTGQESDYSPSRIFTVSGAVVVEADLSGDGVIDIKDWSIFLTRWKVKDGKDDSTIDFNRDGKVNSSDLSIFLRAFRKR